MEGVEASAVGWRRRRAEWRAEWRLSGTGRRRAKITEGEGGSEA